MIFPLFRKRTVAIDALMKATVFLVPLFLLGTNVQAKDLYETLAEAPFAALTTSNHPDLKGCVVLALAARTGQSPTVAVQGDDTIIVVHNWTSPVPGNDVRAIFTLKSDGRIEFRGQKPALLDNLARCVTL